MIFIIPSQEILKAFFDNNISSSASRTRSDAFSRANILKILLKKDVEIIVEGACYEKIEDKITEEHKMIFNKNCKLDNSGVKLNEYDVFSSIKFIVKDKKLALSNSNKMYNYL